MAIVDYDDIGDEYALHSARSLYNAHYDRPAVLDLSGNVHGLDVLDAGCAAGHLSAQLADRGARVTGIDVSPAMIGLAKRNYSDQCSFRVANLANPLDFFDDHSFDLITASLVLHYLKDWSGALAEMRRILRPNGRLVMSVHHPEDWHWFDLSNYFRTELIADHVMIRGARGVLRFYHRPLSAMFSALRAAAFDVDAIAEPMPLPSGADLDPKGYYSLTTAPRFLYFRVVKPEGTS